MRKFYAILFFLAFGYVANAQITLLDSDMGGIGSQYVTAIDTNVAGINLGSPGANQTWDLSMLTTHLIDTVDYLDPATTANASDFPTATLAIRQSLSDQFNYLKVSATSLEVLGLAGDPFGAGTSMAAHLDPTRTLLTFPFTYQTTFLDTSEVDETIPFTQIPFVDSVRYQSLSFLDVLGDGYGDLILGSGTYQVLRVKEISHTIDTIWAHSAITGWFIFDNSDVTDSSFTWWDKNRGFALASASVDSVPDQITYVDPNPVGISPAHFSDNKILIYPNPATSTLFLQSEKAVRGMLEFTDLQGKVVQMNYWNGLKTQINISELPTGVYLYRIRDEISGQRLSGKFIVE